MDTKDWVPGPQSDALMFAPGVIRPQQVALPLLLRVVLYSLLALLGIMLVWACVGRFDVVAVAQGKLVPSTNLLTTVPENEPLIAEVWVGDFDAGFVQADQKVRVKLAAYPFQKYGMLDGVVRQVSADAQEKSDNPSSVGRQLQDTAYRALINLERGHLESQGRRFKLVPGMQVSAEIHLGTRSVIEYLLSPVQKITHEAGRER